MEPRAPSGLFPSGPPRPTFREPHPVRMGAVFAGAAATAAWLLLVGLLSTSIGGYLWLTLSASVPAWLTSAVLLRFGDRGVAVGVAGAAGLGVAVVFVVIIQQWVTVGWPLW